MLDADVIAWDLPILTVIEIQGEVVMKARLSQQLSSVLPATFPDLSVASQKSLLSHFDGIQLEALKQGCSIRDRARINTIASPYAGACCQPLSTSLPEPNAIGDDSATLETIASHSRERTDQSDCLIAADLRDLDTSVRHVEEMISTPVRSGKLSSRRPLFPSTLSPIYSPCPSVNCSSGSETDESNEDQEPRRTADLKTLLTTLDESDQSSEDEYRYESDTDCTSSDDVDELDASYLDDITLSPSTHHASSHDIVDVTTSPVGSKEVLDDQLTVKDMIIPTVQFGISDKDSGGQMPTSSPSSGAIPVVRVSVQPIAITPITIFENDLENRLKLPRVVCDEDCILQLLGKTCRYPFCWEEISVQKKHIGSTLTLQWHCKKFHQGSWSSSARCKSQNGYPFFINNLLFAASVFLSGNNFSKISLLCQFFRLNSISQSTSSSCW
ncbi:uncharacterized protein LOC134187194 [Corticium candelabrum]|uniref:uncharacterized protein LOC134187194 n=1 Tax=Corticium candelabrum TaxID=121492 RepID=UPI002E267778|nr:uncharacterized protein LOC134187194 [Corticium candelabrum]